jgi:uncharacterized membrane protein YhaH (DUF805 family)
MIVLVVVIGFIVGFESKAYNWIAFALQLLFLYPWLALTIKRLHDRDRPDYFAYLMVAPSMVIGLLQALGVMDPAKGMNALGYLLYLIYTVAAIWMLVEFCMRGTVGPNQYGPDPLEGQPQRA